MNLLGNVKVLVLISFFGIGSLEASYGAVIFPTLECGLYDLHGTLVVNSRGHFILKIHENSYSPFEFIILGGSYSDKLRRRNTKVNAEVYVPKVIAGNNAPIVYLQALTPDIERTGAQISLSKKMDCNISEYFKQNP